MKRHFISLGILMFFLSPLPVDAGAPLDTVQTNVNKVLDVLRDPKLKAESAKEIKKEKLEAMYEQMFDEVELSMRSLGGNWKKLSPAQQQEFIQLYRQILEKAYIDKILSYSLPTRKLFSLKKTCSRTTRPRFKRKSSPPQRKSLFSTE